MMNGRAVMHHWLSVLEAGNEKMPKRFAIFRKNSQHGFAGADDVSRCRTKTTEKSLGITFGAKFHSQLDQRRELQSCRLQCVPFAMFPRFDSCGVLLSERAAET